MAFSFLNAFHRETKRQAFHLLFGIIITALIYFGIIAKTTILFIICFFLIIFLLSKKYKIPVVHWFLKHNEREENWKSLPGRTAIYSLVGIYAVMLLFEKDIVLASVMVLSLGDSVAPLFGKFYWNFCRKRKIPVVRISTHKILEGAAAGTIAAFLGALLFVAWHEALAASVAAMIFETLQPKRFSKIIDDNFVIPVVAGAVIWLVRTFL